MIKTNFCLLQIKLKVLLLLILFSLPSLSNPRYIQENGPRDAIKLSSFQSFYSASDKANTADYIYTPEQLNEHKIKFQKDKTKSLSLFPDSLVLASLTKPTNPKMPTLVIIYKSTDKSNKENVSSFLNLWINHKTAFNFILIDPEKTLNQYAMLFLKKYWKDESLKALAFDSSGKIKIQMSDIRDLSRLNSDLTKLAELKTNKE